MPGDPSGIPQVRVLIPTLNEADHIDAVIRQIVTGDPVAQACPVIVADGGSTDGTREIVAGLQSAYPNLRLLDNPGRTQAAALNLMLGADHADTDVLIRCDAHSQYPPRYVSRLVACLKETGAASVVVPMDAQAGDGCFQRGLAWIADTRLGAGGSPHRGGVRSGWVNHGHHAAFRMSVFRALEGYDTRFRANEDAEYDHRLVAEGHKIWLESTIRIGYFPRRSPRALWRQYFHYGRGRARTCRKHRLKPAARQMIPVGHTLLLLGAILTLSVSGLGLIYPTLYLAVISATGVAIAVQHGSPCGLAAMPALAIMHTAWGLGFLTEILAGRSWPAASSPMTT